MDGGEVVETFQVTISPEMRAALVAASEAGKRQAEEEEAEAAAVPPFSITAIVQYMKEWTNLRSVNKIGHDDQFHYFNAKAMYGNEYLQIRVAKVGYIVEGTYYADIESREAAEEHWQCIDSINKEL